MRRFRLLAEAAGATEILACATSALRTAANGGEVARPHRGRGRRRRRRDQRPRGGPARSSRRSAPRSCSSRRRRVCFDLGGGSVEIMVGDVSGLHVGHQRAARRRPPHRRLRRQPTRIDKADRRRLREHVGDGARTPWPIEVAALAPRMAVGSSGTIEDLAHMIAAAPRRVGPRTRCTTSRSPGRSSTRSATTSSRRPPPSAASFDGLDDQARRPDRRRGRSSCATAFELFGIERDDHQRVGAARRAWCSTRSAATTPRTGPTTRFAIRRASVMALARRCGWPEEHSRHVADARLALFDQLARAARSRRRRPRAARVRRAAPRHRRARRPRGPRPARRLSRPPREAARASPRRGHRADRARALAPPGRGQEPRRPRRQARRRPEGARSASSRPCSASPTASTAAASRSSTAVDARVGPDLVLLHSGPHGDPELELWGARRKRDLFERIFGRELELTAHPAGG